MRERARERKRKRGRTRASKRERWRERSQGKERSREREREKDRARIQTEKKREKETKTREKEKEKESRLREKEATRKEKEKENERENERARDRLTIQQLEEKISRLELETSTNAAEHRARVTTALNKKQVQITQLLTRLADQKAVKLVTNLRACRNPNFDVTRTSTLKHWAAGVESFLKTFNIGAAQREAIMRRCAESKGLVVLTQGEHQGLLRDLDQENRGAGGSELTEKFLALLKSNWTESRWVKFRSKTNTSQKKLEQMGVLVTSTVHNERISIEADDGKRDLQIPPTPSSSKQRTWTKSVLLQYSMQPLHDRHKVVGQAACMNEIIRREVDIRREESRMLYQDGTGYMVCAEDGNPLLVVHGYDGAGGFAGQKMVLFSLRFFPLQEEEVNQSLSRVKVFCMYEGLDDNSTLRAVLTKHLPVWNAIIESGSVETEHGRVLCKHKQVTDVVAAQHNLGMTAHVQGYMCPFCTCPATDHCKVDAPTYPSRTLHQAQLYSHTCTGFCPGCQKHVVTAEEYASEIAASNKHPFPSARPNMVVVAEVGDQAPNWYKVKEHLGYTYGATCIIAIEPDDTAACWMHCDSCIVGMMFSSSVLQQLTKFHSTGPEPICKKIFEDLRKCNLTVPKLQAISSTVGEYFASLIKNSGAQVGPRRCCV